MEEFRWQDVVILLASELPDVYLPEVVNHFVEYPSPLAATRRTFTVNSFSELPAFNVLRDEMHLLDMLDDDIYTNSP